MNDKQKTYKLLLDQLKALLENEHDMIANFSNASALLFHNLENINWAGFYLLKNNELILGPFQGKVACMHIPLGKGVCGTCASTLNVQRVDDVHKCSGHIACDCASNSEIVIPLIKKDTLLGVLDIDSYEFSNFDETDEYYLMQFCEILISSLDS